MADFAQTIATAYASDGPALDLGRGVHDGAVAREAVVSLPLRMVNRHGLIAGATGTGKTKTLQGIAEQLASAGVPVFVADVKGDLSGPNASGEPGSAAEKRATDLGVPFTPTAFPVAFLSLGGIGPGVPVRATVSDFGPQLLAKVLGANATQEQSLSLVFHYADEKGATAARSLGSAGSADGPGFRCGQVRAGRHRRSLLGDRRRAAPLARGAGGRRWH